MGAVQHPVGGSALEAIVVAGLAEAVAGGLAEATGARLAARATADLYDAEVAKELCGAAVDAGYLVGWLGEAWIR